MARKWGREKSNTVCKKKRRRGTGFLGNVDATIPCMTTDSSVCSSVRTVACSDVYNGFSVKNAYKISYGDENATFELLNP